MLIDLKATILSYKEKPIQTTDTNDQGVPEERDLIIKDVFVTALNTIADNEVLTVEIKNKIFQLSTKMYKEDTVDLTVDDAAFIKTRVGKIYNALVYGRICEILDKS